MSLAIAIAKAGWRILGPVGRFPGNTLRRIDQVRKASRCLLGPGAVLHPAARISNNRAREDIRIGANSRILARLQTFGHAGSITIGRDCFLGEESYIWSAEKVTIGDRVLISHGVNIHDSISHPLSASQRHLQFLAIFNGGHPKEIAHIKSAPVVIEDDAWIGFGATVLKGVTIGRGAIVGAQSVVTRDVAPFTIVVGNPASVVGEALP